MLAWPQVLRPAGLPRPQFTGAIIMDSILNFNARWRHAHRGRQSCSPAWPRRMSPPSGGTSCHGPPPPSGPGQVRRVGGLVSGVWGLVPGIRGLVSGVWCRVPGAGHQSFGTRCLVSGARCRASELWCTVSSVGCKLAGARCRWRGCQVHDAQ